MKITRLLLAAAAPLAASFVQAADLYKVNNSDSLNQLTAWSTTSGSQTPNPGSLGADNWYFNEVTMLGGKTLSLGGDLTIGGLALDYATSDTANNLTIAAGNTLTLNGGTLGGLGVAGANYSNAGIVLNRGTGGTLTINSNVALGASQQWVSGRTTGGFTVAGDVNLGAYTLTTNITSTAATGTSTISGAISGTAGSAVEAIKKTGNGVLVLSGNNSYSGVTTLGAGTGAATSNVLELGNANALGTSTLAFRGGLLRANTAGLTVANAMNVAAGGVRLGGTNSFTLSGTLTMDAASRTIANYSSNGSTVTIGGITTVAASTVAFDNAANAATGAPIIISGAITGAGAVALSGNQNTTLAGINTYTGATSLSGGNLTLTGSTAAGSAFTMSGGTLTGTGTVNGTMAISGGSIRLTGGATTNGLTFNQGVTFTNAPTVLFIGSTTAFTAYDVFSYGSGTVNGIANLRIGYRGTLADDTVNKKYVFTTGEYGATRTWNTTTGTWDGFTTANFAEGDQKFATGDNVVFGDIASDSVVTLTGTLTPGSVTVGNAANKYTFQTGSMTGATSLTKNGAGVLQINSNQSYTGGTTVNGGKLILAGGGSTGTIRGTLTANAGTTIEIGGADSLGYSTGSDAVRTINLNGATLNQAQNRNETNTAIINMAGGSTISATGGVSAQFDMLGNSAAINSTGDTTNTISSRINFRQNNTTFTVADGAAATDLLVSGVISRGAEGNGALVKAGAGTMALTAANTYNGNTTISAGTLVLSGTGSIYDNATKTGAGSLTINGGGVLVGDRWTWGSGQSLGQLNYNAGNIAVDNGAIRSVAAASTSFENRGIAVGSGGMTLENATTGTTWTIASGANASTFAANAKMTLSGAGNGDFQQVISNANAGVNVEKSGAGAWVLSGTNTYTGGTTVTNGTLTAGNASAFGSGAIAVNGGVLNLNGQAVANAVTLAGGTFQGGSGYTGTISGTSGSFLAGADAAKAYAVNAAGVTFTNLSGQGTFSGGAVTVSGTHAVGNSPGAQTFSSGLTYADGATVALEFDNLIASSGVGGTNWDTIAVTGGLSIGTGVSLTWTGFNDVNAVDYTGAAWDSSFSRTLISADSITGAFNPFSDFVVDGQGTWSITQNGNTLDATWTAVPEPSTYGLLGAGALAAAAFVRRRRKHAGTAA